MRALGLAAWLLVAGLPLGCDGEPLGDRTITVELGYQDQTNYGPETATGLVTIETATGLVTLSVQGMPRLEGQSYQAWLFGGGEERLSVFVFNTSESGTASLSATLGDLTQRTYESIEITVEPDPDPDPDPSPRRTIGGHIPGNF